MDLDLSAYTPPPPHTHTQILVFDGETTTSDPLNPVSDSVLDCQITLTNFCSISDSQMIILSDWE